MTAIGQNWLLVIMVMAVVVILSSRGAVVWQWVQQFIKRSPEDEQLQMIIYLVESGKNIADPAQRRKVRDVCIACFCGWLDAKFPS